MGREPSILTDCGRKKEEPGSGLGSVKNPTVRGAIFSYEGRLRSQRGAYTQAQSETSGGH